MTPPRSCVAKNGRFIVGVHQPEFSVKNLRENDYPCMLGKLQDGTLVDNAVNFPAHDLYEPGADTIYEIANAFDFRGTTYINSAWADAKAGQPEKIQIPLPKPCSLLKNLAQNPEQLKGFASEQAILEMLPHPLRIALAQASTDPEELVLLAEKSCQILFDENQNTPMGIGFKKNAAGVPVPDIYDHELFEVLVNNPHLPDDYKNALVLKPGVQGRNEITGEYRSQDGATHVFEYLRRNSYIPWGHFASNMANDAIRYRAADLDQKDMTGIRHLYYQRVYVRMAQLLKIPLPKKRSGFNPDALEDLRQRILSQLKQNACIPPEFNNTLWGWNFGFGYAQSGHRLHASHQMIHQQNAMIPRKVPTQCGQTMEGYSCGQMVETFIRQYKNATGQPFFQAYLSAVQNNVRTDGKKELPGSLVVLENDQILVFVPKAPICEWELQLMTKSACGNILEADTRLRQAIDDGILMAVRSLEKLGAQFVTGIEFSKPFDSDRTDQHLLYSFIPKLPYAPGTFSEAQLRWISGCYPEDVALACRSMLNSDASRR